MTYYQKHKEERKEKNRQNALEYYYRNIEQRKEYNKKYWQENYLELYTKRLLKKNCSSTTMKEYQHAYYEKHKYDNQKTNITDVYNLCLKKDNTELKKNDMVIKCYFD